MAKINVREFRDNTAELLRKQKEAERLIDFEAITRRVGDVANPQMVEELSASSEFFADPTLFSLLRHHKEAQMDWERRSRVRREGGADKPVSRKPQAKDVFPNRVLEEDDEKLIREMEEGDNLGPDQYINPWVPKKRRYVAESKVPTILRAVPTSEEANFFTRSGSIVSNSGVASSVSTPVALASYPFEETEISYSAASTPTSDAFDLGVIQPQLALPKFIPTVNDEEDNQSMTTMNDSVPAELEVMDHPDIPETQLSRTFLDMAKSLQNSPLKTVSQSSMVDLLPRQRARLNYAPINRPSRKVMANPLDEEEEKYEDDDDDDDDYEDQKQYEYDGNDGNKNGIHGNQLAGEVVLSVAIYHPKNAGQRLQEFHVLGSQSLSDLRDIIYCLRDFSMNRDRVGQAEDGAVLNTSKKKMSNSFFFIEDVFYVDSRAEKEGMTTEVDDSIRIQKWMMNNNRYNQSTVTEYTKRDMQDILFEDLEVRLNKPYIFFHQNGCEHLVMIRDIWIHSSREAQNECEYPLIVYNWRYTRFKCTMCSVYPAEYITTNDLMSGFSPCYFCKQCFKPFHYDKDGKQKFSFTVTDYYGM